MQSDEDILDYWFEKKNLSKNSRELYTLAMKQYSELIGKTIRELYYEADKEEEENIKLDKRKYSFYTIKFKEWFRIHCIRFFYVSKEPIYYSIS